MHFYCEGNTYSLWKFRQIQKSVSCYFLPFLHQHTHTNTLTSGCRWWSLLGTNSLNTRSGNHQWRSRSCYVVVLYLTCSCMTLLLGFFGLKLYELSLNSIVHRYRHMSFGILPNYTTWSSDCPMMNLPPSPTVRQLDRLNFFGIINDSVMNSVLYKTFVPMGDQFLGSGIWGREVRRFLSLLIHVANRPSGKDVMRIGIPATHEDVRFITAWAGLNINRKSEASMARSTALLPTCHGPRLH